MQNPIIYRLLADAVLLTHAAVVVFVVGGLVLVIVGNLQHWRWVNALLFRVAHLVAVGVVVVQAWLGALCPLTVLESWLREQAGEAPYAAGFIAHWVQRLLFYAAPFWVFTLVYTLFGLLVAATWWYFPPARTGDRDPATDD
jgi:polyferredoxin